MSVVIPGSGAFTGVLSEPVLIGEEGVSGPVPGIAPSLGSMAAGPSGEGSPVTAGSVVLPDSPQAATSRRVRVAQVERFDIGSLQSNGSAE
jgi:hypothetical protein